MLSLIGLSAERLPCALWNNGIFAIRKKGIDINDKFTSI